jgi:hypothetical protein
MILRAFKIKTDAAGPQIALLLRKEALVGLQDDTESPEDQGQTPS